MDFQNLYAETRKVAPCTQTFDEMVADWELSDIQSYIDNCVEWKRSTSQELSGDDWVGDFGENEFSSQEQATEYLQAALVAYALNNGGFEQ